MDYESLGLTAGLNKLKCLLPPTNRRDHPKEKSPASRLETRRSVDLRMLVAGGDRVNDHWKLLCDAPRGNYTTKSP